MGNQHSAPDKDKDKDRDKEPPKETPKDVKDKPAVGDPVRTGSKHEKHRSRTITSVPLPPAETKVNADHSHNAPTSAPAVALPIPSTTTTSSASEGRSLDPKTSIESSAAGSGTASPAKARRTSKTIAQKDVVDAIKEMHRKDLQSSADHVPHEEGLEPTPKFETLRVASQTSFVDEDEDNDADKDGSSVIVEDLRVGPEKIPLVLDWMDGGKKVAVAGTFTGWRKRINLRKTYHQP
jgi:Glycogen recognition site of AMP-activated protein kinase